MFQRTLVLFTILTAALCASAQFGSPDSLGYPHSALDTSNPRLGLRATLTGVVQDSTGHPVDGARVDVLDGSGRSVGGSFTGPSGAYEIDNIPCGVYQVNVSHGPDETRSQVEIDGSQELSVRLPTRTPAAAGGNRDSFSATQANVPGKARQLLEKAQEALHKARLDDAFAFVQKALTVCPTYAKALSLRGILNMEKGDTKAAEPDLEKAVQLDYGDSMGFVALGSLYNTEGRFDNALQTLEHGMSLNPKSWQANLEMARAEIGKQDFGAAVRSLDRSEMFAPPEETLTKLFRAQALAGLKDYKGAIDALEAFMNKSPNDPNAPQARQMLAKLKDVTATLQP